MATAAPANSHPVDSPKKKVRALASVREATVCRTPPTRRTTVDGTARIKIAFVCSSFHVFVFSLQSLHCLHTPAAGRLLAILLNTVHVGEQHLREQRVCWIWQARALL